MFAPRGSSSDTLFVRPIIFQIINRMSEHRKSILTATLSKLDPAALAAFGGEDVINAGIAASVMKANADGFDLNNIAMDSADHSDTLKRLEQQLTSRHWDGFLIGFGIRGNKAYTPLFEAAVNLCRKVAPETMLMFGNSWDDLSITLARNFPVER